MANNVTETVSANQIEKASEALAKEKAKKQASSNTNGAKNNAEQNKKQTTEQKVQQLSKKAKDAESDVYANIETGIGILETLPQFVDLGLDAITTNSFTFQYSPLGLIIDLLNVVGVTDADIRKFIVDLLVYTLPAIEIGVKGIILSNIKSIVSCAADPRIPKKLRKKTGEKYDNIYGMFNQKYNDERGMLIDLSSIDPEGILFNSPYSERGKNSYFGVYSNELNDFYNDIGLDTNEAKNKKGLYVKSREGNTEFTLDKVNIRQNVKSKWELCRAEDKDAFLWFVINHARFPNPLRAVFYPNSVKINNHTYYCNNGNATIFKPLELQKADLNDPSDLAVGSNIMAQGGVNEISLCIKTDIKENASDTGATDIVKNYFVPVSSDGYSADWYVEPDQYFKGNLGLAGKKNKYNYEKQKAICNIEFVQPTNYKTNYVGGSTQKLRFTILPKPYVYIPCLDEKIQTKPIKRILFDEYGNPDPNGCFSLPTEKTTSDGLPYVRNEKVSPFTDKLAVQKIVESNDFDSKLSSVIKEINDAYNKKGYPSINVAAAKVDITEKYTSSWIDAFYLSVYYRNAESGEDKASKAKYVDFLKECLNLKIQKETQNGLENGYTKLRVGEVSDNCALYIRDVSGETSSDYFLARYNNINDRGFDNSGQNYFAKHLVRCYKGLTVYEFNYDFVMGLKLFSPKVVCAKLLEAATNSSYVSTFKVDINYSKDTTKYQYLGNQQIIEKIVRDIVEKEDAELTDCFYNFSNEEYETMLNETEEKRFHQQPYLNDKTETVDLSDVFEMLSNYPENGTKQEQRTLIENVITAATAKVSSNRNVYAAEDSTKLKINFVENMLQQLTAILVNSILTPKLLLLIAVNKQLMGDGGETFNIKDLLNGMKGLIVAIVKELRDMIIQKLLDYLLDYLGPLAKELLEREVKEKYAVYSEILTQLLGYLKTFQGTYNTVLGVINELKDKYSLLKGKKYSNYDLPTVLDNVDYADIIKNNSDTGNTDSPITNNC